MAPIHIKNLSINLSQHPNAENAAPYESGSLWSEPLPVLTRNQERLDHFCLDVVAVECIQLVEPKGT